MPAKTILVLYLFITVLLFESFKESECSSVGHMLKKYSQLRRTGLFPPLQKPVRSKRSPCIVGTRWRTTRCRRGEKRAFSKAQLVSFSLLVVRVKLCSNMPPMKL